MMPLPLYVPVLKGKDGEYGALEALRNDVKSMLMPLIEIPAVPYDYINERPTKRLDDHVSDVPARLKRACPNTPLFLDLPWFEKEETISGGQTALEYILTRCVAIGLNPVPVISLSSTGAYRAAARSHAITNNSGSCIRLLTEDFGEDVDLEEELNRLIASATDSIDSTDLIIDLEDLGLDAGKAVLVARSIFSMVPHRVRWRRIILIAASFPEDLSDVSAATMVTLPRYEWDLWKTLQRKPNMLPRPDLLFGDYAMAHPVSKSHDPRKIRMSANIRYTTEDSWLVVKGRNVRKFGFDQYFDLCRLLVKRPEYQGLNFSWGDRYVADCAEGMQGPGNATTWRKVGVNHHITLVTLALSTLRPVL